MFGARLMQQLLAATRALVQCNSARQERPGVAQHDPVVTRLDVQPVE
jgi:hypothetical protein